MSQVFAEDVGAPEGPVFAADGTFFIVEMAGDRTSLTRLSKEGRTVVATTAGRPNGLACDGDGNLWVAEAHEGAVLCFAPDGKLLGKIAGDKDGRFLWPNDLAFGPDGLLYLTDSGVLDDDFIDGQAIRSDFRDMPFDGRVYRIDPARGEVLDVIDRGLRFTNGIAFDPQGILHVNETLSGNVYRYADDAGGRTVREVYANVLHGLDDGNFRGPDGMKFDRDGRLYCAVYGQQEVTVIGPSGQIERRLKTRGSKPTNLAFAPGGTAIYVTEVETSSVEIIEVGAPGLPLHCPSLRAAA